MSFLTIIQCIGWFICIPYVFGKLLNGKDEDEENNKLVYTWLLGSILMMAIFMIIALPMVLLKMKFNTLKITYCVVILVLSVISIIINRKKLLKFTKPKSFSLFQIVAIILVIIQVFIRVKYATINNDDVSFVGLATEMISTGDMYVKWGELIARRALAPSSAYYAAMSQYLFVHVTILTHTIIPVFVVLLANAVYYYLGRKLFKNDDESSYIFLIFMILVNFYFFRYKGASAYLLKFPWFGRVVTAGIMLPLIWKLSFDAMSKEQNKIKDWFKIFITVIAACLFSEMAIAIITIPIIVLSIIGAIRDKKISYLFKGLLTIIPCLIIAIIYINIR